MLLHVMILHWCCVIKKTLIAVHLYKYITIQICICLASVFLTSQDGLVVTLDIKYQYMLLLDFIFPRFIIHIGYIPSYVRNTWRVSAIIDALYLQLFKVPRTLQIVEYKEGAGWLYCLYCHFFWANVFILSRNAAKSHKFLLKPRENTNLTVQTGETFSKLLFSIMTNSL